MTTNETTGSVEHARLSGHELRNEGAAFVWDIGSGRRFLKRVLPQGVSGIGRAACSCGVTSPVMPSGAARKQWHREHKEAWR